MNINVYNFMKDDIITSERKGSAQLSQNSITNYIARRIRKFRELKGMTQQELADRVGVKYNTISNYETGTNKPGNNVLFVIAQVLDVGIDSLFPPTKGDLSLIVNDDKDAHPYTSTSLSMLPIVGRISCGNGILAYEDVEGYEPVPDEWLYGGEHFCLRAKGDSMIGARIHEGDLLLIRRQPEVENGEIAAVLIDDEAVLKRVYIHDGKLVLQSENPKYPPMITSPSDTIIIGKLKKIIINL